MTENTPIKASSPPQTGTDRAETAQDSAPLELNTTQEKRGLQGRYRHMNTSRYICNTRSTSLVSKELKGVNPKIREFLALRSKYITNKVNYDIFMRN